MPAAAGPLAATSVTRPGTDGGASATVTYAYDANGNNTSSTDGRTIAYTAFDKPRTIAKGNHATTFAYGPDRSRFKRADAVTVGTGAEAVTRTTTTLYLGGVERITRPDGTVQVRRHICGTYKVEGGMETFGDSRFEFQVPEGSHFNLYAKGAAVRACGFWCAACSAAGAFPTGFCG